MPKPSNPVSLSDDLGEVAEKITEILRVDDLPYMLRNLLETLGSAVHYWKDVMRIRGR